MRTAIAPVLLIATLSSASAEFITVPKASTFSTLSAQIEEVSAATGLSEEIGMTARITASQWVFLGPCKGSSKELRLPDEAVFQTVIDANPRTPWGSAVLQMIAVLMRDDLGRYTETRCEFAKAMANSGP